ncbi:MAG: alpha/beta fold hydrolase [Nitrospirae bacterium]|nr:alpha/beta fold hydrolase [Nitrospirota bacterium]
MQPDVTIHKGQKDKPVVIFIHGLGIDKDIWLNPLNTKIFAKNVPIKIFAAKLPRPLIPPCPPLKKGGYLNGKLTIGDIPEKVDSLWTALKDRGFNLVCWSQRRPVGPMDAAVEELKKIMEIVRESFPGKPVALIGHSRGGLIARKFMEAKPPEVTALITISTPHSGSSLALLGKYLKPLSPPLKVILPKDAHGTLSGVLKRFSELIEGNATRELLPGSDFFKSLKDVPADGVKYMSFGGTKTKLLTVYTWKRRHDEMPYPTPLLTIPDSLLKILPSSKLPDELKTGKGDFLVSAKSSELPWASNHYNVSANHITILWNKKVIGNTVKILEEIS